MAQCQAAPKNKTTSPGFPVKRIHFPKNHHSYLDNVIFLRTWCQSGCTILIGKFINQDDRLRVQWKRGVGAGREGFVTIKIPVGVIDVWLCPP